MRQNGTTSRAQDIQIRAISAAARLMLWPKRIAEIMSASAPQTVFPHGMVEVRFFAATKDAFELLTRHRESDGCEAFRWRGCGPVPSFENYLIFYLPTETELHVLAVLHGARDLPRALEGRLD